MQKLAEICIDRPVFATVLILTLVVVGAFGYSTLGLDRFPNVDFPFVTVTTAVPGRGSPGDGDRRLREARGGGQFDLRRR